MSFNCALQRLKLTELLEFCPTNEVFYVKFTCISFLVELFEQASTDRLACLEGLS
jgi:hypothetical protein